MKIIVTGASGQLGSEIRVLSASHNEYEFVFTDLPELDITSSIAVEKFMAANSPDAIINCAAYTAVDKAETDWQAAYAVNAAAPEILAKAASSADSLLIHISTDYVFGGKGFMPWTESDETNPVSVYAKSKYTGELAVARCASKALIVRTSWLYSAFGSNFVKTIRKHGAEKGSLNVVYDQIGTPTYARDLAACILAILPAAADLQGTHIFHYSNEGVASWYDFAKAIIELSAIECTVKPVSTAEYPLPAARPFYSVLSKSRIKQHFGIEIPYWRDSLRHCISRLGEPGT